MPVRLSYEWKRVLLQRKSCEDKFARFNYWVLCCIPYSSKQKAGAANDMMLQYHKWRENRAEGGTRGMLQPLLAIPGNNALSCLTNLSVCQYYWPVLAFHRYIGIGIYVLWYALILKQFFKAIENAWTGDLKLCNYVVCPVEGRLIFNNQYVKYLPLSVLPPLHLSQEFDNHIQSILSANM